MEKSIEQRRKEAVEYLNSKEYKISFSQWTQFVQSPRHLLRYLSGEFEQTAVMTFSAKFHTFLLEGEEKFYEKYVVNEKGITTNSYQERMFIKELVEDGMKGVEMNWENAFKAVYKIEGKSEQRWKGEAKDKWNKFKNWIKLKVDAGLTGKEIVSRVDLELMQDLKGVFEDDLDMVRLFKQGIEFEKKAEGEVVVKDASGNPERDFKVNATGRIDIGGVNGKKKFIADLKVIADASTRRAMRSVSDYWLFVQGGLYSLLEWDENWLEGEYYLLLLDKKGNSNIFELSKEYRSIGMEKFKEYLLWFRLCRNVNGWRRSYNFFSERGDGVFDINPPYWLT